MWSKPASALAKFRRGAHRRCSAQPTQSPKILAVFLLLFLFIFLHLALSTAVELTCTTRGPKHAALVPCIAPLSSCEAHYLLRVLTTHLRRQWCMSGPEPPLHPSIGRSTLQHFRLPSHPNRRLLCARVAPRNRFSLGFESWGEAPVGLEFEVHILGLD